MIPAIDQMSSWAENSLLLSLRLGPVLSFAPPFTLMRIPAPFRLLLALGISGLMAQMTPALSVQDQSLIAAGFRELLLGVIFVLVFQAAYGALHVAGRTIDIQAGFGLAALVDPTSRTRTPLVGTLYAYVAGVIFFTLGGHLDLLRIVAASLEMVPLGQASTPASLGPISAYLGTVFALAFGVAGGVILALMLADGMIAILARTAPQLNVLVLGFQVKTVLLLVALPVTLGVASALLTRLSAVTLEALPMLIA